MRTTTQLRLSDHTTLSRARGLETPAESRLSNWTRERALDALRDTLQHASSAAHSCSKILAGMPRHDDECPPTLRDAAMMI